LDRFFTTFPSFLLSCSVISANATMLIDRCQSCWSITIDRELRSRLYSDWGIRLFARSAAGNRGQVGTCWISRILPFLCLNILAIVQLQSIAAQPQPSYLNIQLFIYNLEYFWLKSSY
jgi:hypothetical protein